MELSKVKAYDKQGLTQPIKEGQVTGIMETWRESGIGGKMHFMKSGILVGSEISAESICRCSQVFRKLSQMRSNSFQNKTEDLVS